MHYDVNNADIGIGMEWEKLSSFHTRIPTDLGNKIGERLTNHYSEIGVHIFVREFLPRPVDGQTMWSTMVFAMHVPPQFLLFFRHFPNRQKITFLFKIMHLLRICASQIQRFETAGKCQKYYSNGFEYQEKAIFVREFLKRTE